MPETGVIEQLIGIRPGRTDLERVDELLETARAILVVAGETLELVQQLHATVNEKLAALDPLIKRYTDNPAARFAAHRMAKKGGRDGQGQD